VFVRYSAQQLSCAILLLPVIFREKPQNWFTINELITVIICICIICVSVSPLALMLGDRKGIHPVLTLLDECPKALATFVIPLAKNEKWPVKGIKMCIIMPTPL